jgi:hypothetical protein
MSGARTDPASFRDPHSRVFFVGDGVYRALSADGVTAWHALDDAGLVSRWVEQGHLVGAALLDDIADVPLPDGSWEAVLRHDRVPFISYPYEWTFGMLRDAAALFLKLVDTALDAGLATTDATPYNVQWRGPQPTYIDVGSFVPRHPGEPWAAYRQFCETWLAPLLLAAHRGIDHRPLLRGRLGGIPITEARRYFGLADLRRPGVFLHVWLHGLAAAKDRDAEVGLEAARSGAFADQAVRNTVRSLQRTVERLRPRALPSTWSDYDQVCPSYSDDERRSKRKQVERVLASKRWSRVVDLGANTGEYSLMASRHADEVIAVEGDAGAAEVLFQRLRQAGVRNVWPIAVDVADPSPSLGLGLQERPSILERAEGELVLALALMHHVVVTAQVPWPAFARLLVGLGQQVLVEWVPPEDPMAARLLRLRGAACYDYRREAFEAAIEAVATVDEVVELGEGGRVLFG